MNEKGTQKLMNEDLNPTQREIVEAIAHICHEANRAYCATHGDFDHMPWNMAAEELKSSVRSGVLHVIRNPRASQPEMHRRWMERRLADGWVWGPVKDPVAKTHPNLCAYEALPPTQKVKDKLFINIVLALAFPRSDFEDHGAPT